MSIPIKNLNYIHEITFGPAVEKMNKRIESMGPLKNLTEISYEQLNAVMYSKNPIRVVKLRKDTYVIFDGNGRYWPLREYFGEKSEVKIEVEYYEVKNPLFRWSIENTLVERGIDPDLL